MSAPCPTLGFIITIGLRPTVTEQQSDAMLRDLEELLERHGLASSGGGARVTACAVTRDGGQATDMDREVVREWARGWIDQATITIGDITELTA